MTLFGLVKSHGALAPDVQISLNAARLHSAERNINIPADTGVFKELYAPPAKLYLSDTKLGSLNRKSNLTLQQKDSFSIRRAFVDMGFKSVSKIDDFFMLAFDQLLGKQGYVASGVVSGLGYASLGIIFQSTPKLSALFHGNANGLSLNVSEISNGLISTLPFSGLLFMAAYAMNLLRNEGKILNKSEHGSRKANTIVGSTAYFLTSIGCIVGTCVELPILLAREGFSRKFKIQKFKIPRNARPL